MNLLLLFGLVCSVYGSGSFIDVNDILNVDYMPGSLLLLEGNDDELVGRNVTIKPEKTDAVTGGSIKEAFSTMGFHRKMMNEYLCRNFVADQILSEMSLTRIRRRLGTAVPQRHRDRVSSNDLPHVGKQRTDLATIKESMLADEGSAGYKHWLTKSTTLEDIYRHYENMQDREIDDHSAGDADDVDPDADEYEGQVTGYSVPHGPPHHAGPPHRGGGPAKVGYGHSAAGAGYGQTAYPGGGGGGGHSGYGGSGHSGGGYDFTPQHIYYHHGGHHEDYEEHGKGEKDLALADLFEIALTAIAFLSFGCFILQVIMCITSANTTTTVTTVTMMPMMMTNPANDDGDTDSGTTGDGDAEPVRIRYKRDLPPSINYAINDLARRVLTSVESALVAEEDDGNCLRQKLCENNKYSRTLTDNQRIWVPVWSFGMSWLSGRLSTRLPPSTTMLDSLKASILGLGNANCKAIYNNCNLHKLRENRHRKRKKRSMQND